MTSLRLADVTFSYDDCEGPIVENFSYELDEGTISLISGPSGCGKSTVFKLMAGLLPQYGGKILSGKVLWKMQRSNPSCRLSAPNESQCCFKIRIVNLR